MYRDFSASSKKKILGLVSEVENEKLSNFTDWVGDRWYDFETWIGKLNIKNYLNNVNTYHKKVIDKNNATKSSIEKIFNDVAAVDSSYKNTFSTTKSLLQQWKNYINEMNQIVSPKNGKFSSDYITATLNAQLKSISQIEVDNEKVKTREELTKDILKGESKFLKLISKIAKKDKDGSNDVALTSSAMSYLAGLYTFYSTDYKSSDELISGGLKFTKSSTTMWENVYKYLEKNLQNNSAIQASRFGKQYQSKVGMVSLVGNILGFTGDSVMTAQTLMNEDAETYEKVSSVLKNTGSGLDVGQSIVNLKYGQKVLTRGVTAKYQWDVAAKNVSKFNKATATISVLGVVADTAVGATDRYGKVTADGTFDMGDMGEMYMAGSVRGLTSVVGKLTFGISDTLGLSEKSEEITDNIIEFADTKGVDFVNNHAYSSQYVQNAQFLKNYANDEDNNIVLRTGASVIAGTGMIGAIAVDGISDGVNWMGNQISSGWNTVKNWF